MRRCNYYLLQGNKGQAGDRTGQERARDGWMAKRSVTRPGWMDGDERRLHGESQECQGRAAAAGRRLDLADGMDGASTWNTGFCGSPSPNSCRGRGTNVDVSGPWPAAVQRRHATTRACFFGGQSLASTQQPAAGRQRNVQGSLKPRPSASPSPRAAPQTWVINRCSWCGPPRRNSRDTAFASKWMQPAVLGTDGRKEEKMVKKRYGGFVPVPGPGR